jgi:hypothetical protein
MNPDLAAAIRAYREARETFLGAWKRHYNSAYDEIMAVGGVVTDTPTAGACRTLTAGAFDGGFRSYTVGVCEPTDALKSYDVERSVPGRWYLRATDLVAPYRADIGDRLIEDEKKLRVLAGVRDEQAETLIALVSVARPTRMQKIEFADLIWEIATALSKGEER